MTSQVHGPKKLLRLYFFTIVQDAQAAWLIWLALAGQHEQSGQQ